MKKIITTALLSLITIGAFAQNVDEIVKKHIDAIGGLENWKKLKSMRTEASMKAQGAEIKFVMTQIHNVATRQDISAMGMNGYSFMTKTEGWAFMPFQGQTKPEAMTADDIKNGQDDLSIMDEFITYKELGKKLEYLGKDDVDGTECLKLKMTDKDAQETTFFIDPSNYYVIKQISKVKADGKEMENAVTFGDYKKLPEGIVVSMTNAGGWGEMSITKVEVNPKIDESIFKLAK